jgi:hypothetical protein
LIGPVLRIVIFFMAGTSPSADGFAALASAGCHAVTGMARRHAYSAPAFARRGRPNMGVEPACRGGSHEPGCGHAKRRADRHHRGASSAIAMPAYLQQMSSEIDLTLRVLLTKSAERFIDPQVAAWLADEAYVSYDPKLRPIEVAKRSFGIVVLPASANMLASTASAWPRPRLRRCCWPASRQLCSSRA